MNCSTPGLPPSPTPGVHSDSHPSSQWCHPAISSSVVPFSSCPPKASILWCSAFFTVQLSHPYMTTGKAIALIRRTLVGKVMSLLLNMLSRLVITFLPGSKSLLISWLQSPSAVILEPPKIKSDSVLTVPHLFPMKWWDWMPWSSFSECWALSQLFHSPLSLSSRGFLVPLHFLP